MLYHINWTLIFIFVYNNYQSIINVVETRWESFFRTIKIINIFYTWIWVGFQFIIEFDKGNLFLIKNLEIYWDQYRLS